MRTQRAWGRFQILSLPQKCAPGRLGVDAEAGVSAAASQKCPNGPKEAPHALMGSSGPQTSPKKTMWGQGGDPPVLGPMGTYWALCGPYWALCISLCYQLSCQFHTVKCAAIGRCSHRRQDKQGIERRGHVKTSVNCLRQSRSGRRARIGPNRGIPSTG